MRLYLISALGLDEFGDRQAAFASMMACVKVAALVFTDGLDVNISYKTGNKGFSS